MKLDIISPNALKLSCLDEYSERSIIGIEKIDVRIKEEEVSAFMGDHAIIDQLKVHPIDKGYRISIKADFDGIFGLGERFDHVNHKNHSRMLNVEEKFTSQGSKTYCPIPFFFTDTGFGIFLNELSVTRFEFGSDEIAIDIFNQRKKEPEVYLLFGTPKEIISQFSQLTGQAALPPKWAFGPWMSGHRWNSRKLVEEQLYEAEQLNMPFNVLVLEQWSDESTFYIWNDVQYHVRSGEEFFCYSDFEYESSLWPDPKEMIEKIHQKGMKVILWQAPMLKNPENKQQEMDYNYARDHGLVVQNEDGTPYKIPQGHWFNGSMIPDFTNPETCQWYYGKKRYLLDIGVDGFKSDGGEFVHREDIRFYDGSTGVEMKNGYVQSYLRTFNDFIGRNRVLFSRAGYIGQQQWPMHWAGDQKSTWEEFRAILVAGLTAGLSGIPFWSFDIAGFAGPMPSVELYERSTQMAVFTPGMQWHSEPVYGQFADIMPSAGGKNDRSPWNMARAYGDKDLVQRVKFHYDLRMNLLPYLYNEAINSSETGLPMMRHLYLEYPEDKNTLDIQDQFMVGDLLVAPITDEASLGRSVYMPQGQWIDLWNRKEYEGGKSLYFKTGKERIPVFIRKGGALALNVGDELCLGSFVGNQTEKYKNLCFLITGEEGQYNFRDNLDNHIKLSWRGGEVKHKVLSGSESYRILV